MSWYRIDEWREISANFITCAEFQLFLDEKRAQGEYRQPDHWDDHQFPKGCALEPILGVRGQDADRFCEWLSQRRNNKFRYRLPTSEEICNLPEVVEREIGYWCTAEGKRFVSGPKLAYWIKLSDTLISEWNHVVRVNALDLILSLDLDPNLADILDLTLALTRTLALDSALDIVIPLDFDLTHALDLDFDLALTFDLTFTLNFARDLALARDPALVFAFDIDRTINRTHDFAYNLTYNLAHRPHNFASSRLSALRSLCCTFIFLWTLIKRVATDINRDIKQKLDTVLNLYVFFFLVDERRKGNLPAWEGIRIVRERLE